MSLLTLITVTYNLVEAGRIDTLREAVESVQSQSFTDVEHVIVDGASTDGTVGFLDELLLEQKSGPIPMRFISEPDQSLYDAMNKGVALAKGEYVLFLNSDDYLTSKNSLAHLAQALHDGVDYAYGQQETLFLDGRKVLWKRMSPRNLLIRMPFGYGSLAFRRDKFVELGGHDLAFKICADYDLVTRLLLAGARGVPVYSPICTFREGGVSADTAKTGNDHVGVWRKNLAPWLDLSGFSNAQMFAWLQTGRIPYSVCIRIACNPAGPKILRKSAITALWIGTRKRLSGRFKPAQP